MVSIILTGLFPSVVLVLIGGLVRNRLSQTAWQGVDRLNFEILFPALLFTAASARPIDPGDLLVMWPLVCAVLGLGVMLSWFARPYGPERFLDFAGCWQTAWRFNTALGFVVVSALPSADIGLYAIAIGLGIPLVNIMAIAALSRGTGLSALMVVRKVALNPFLLGALAGVLVGITQIPIPELVMSPVQMLGAAAIPVALISVGASLNWSSLGQMDGFARLIVTIKLIVLPLAVTLVALVFDLSHPVVPVLIIFAALPPATAAHVLAAGFGADKLRPATLVAQATLLSAATLPIWMIVAEALGV